MSDTRANKYKMAAQIQARAGKLAASYRELKDLCKTAHDRGLGDGGTDPIVDADLNPGDSSIGRDLGITAAKLFAVMDYGFANLELLMTGESTLLERAINIIRSDV